MIEAIPNKSPSSLLKLASVSHFADAMESAASCRENQPPLFDTKISKLVEVIEPVSGSNKSKEVAAEKTANENIHFGEVICFFYL